MGTDAIRRDTELGDAPMLADIAVARVGDAMHFMVEKLRGGRYAPDEIADRPGLTPGECRTRRR